MMGRMGWIAALQELPCSDVLLYQEKSTLQTLYLWDVIELQYSNGCTHGYDIWH